MHALNTKDRLPKYLLILPDKDIIEYARQDDYGAADLLEDLIDWMCKNFELTLDMRKEDIRGKRLGAMWSYSEPRLIWVKMCVRPILDVEPDIKFIFAQCSKFNEALDNAVLKYRHSHVMNIHFTDDTTIYFSYNYI